MTIYYFDGSEIDSLDAFYDVIEREMLLGQGWGRNLDALDDILRGEYGPVPALFTVVWRNARQSMERLGYAETMRQLEVRLTRCHPDSRSHVAQELESARQGVGPTVYDWLVEIFRSHDNVDLVIEP